MKLYNVKLLTVTCEILAQKNIIEILKKHNITGYTTYEVEGNGARGLRGQGLQTEKNVKIEIIMREEKEKDSKFIVVTVSNAAQVHPDPTFRKSFIKKINNNDLFYPEKRIKKLGDEKGFLVINLAEKMKNYAQKNKIFLHGFANTVMGEGHWNLDGHKIASQIISKEMCESLER